jgi:regulator of sirC expression with transglutaminase-like and TPR domain
VKPPVTPETLYRALDRELARAPIDLAEAALLLAALDCPEARLDDYRAHLDTLASDVGAAAEDADDPVAALNTVLFDRHGYDGARESYDDLDNVNLIRVIDRRRGLPVSLSILYLHAARARGWSAAGLNFPGHFLVRVGDGAGQVIVDPFHRGRRLSAEQMRALLKKTSGPEAELRAEHYDAASDRAVLLRLQNNVKLRAVQGQDYDRAIRALTAMIHLAPDRFENHCDIAMLHAHRGNVITAIEVLETVIALSPDPTLRQRATGLLTTLRRRLN